MTNRIADTFAELKAAGRKALVGYLTAGDPDPAASEQHVRTALDAGLDVLELGMPFSDPTADGPTIQEASRRALAAGMNLRKALDMVARIRGDYELPIVLFGYANPFFLYGYERICAESAQAGVDGLLVVDLSFEETDELRPVARRHGLCLIPLIAPTTPQERARAVLKDARGFVYYIMVKGVTGARDRVVSDLAEHVTLLRGVTDLPIVAGFGVSSGRQAREAAAAADGVVVGSALVRAAADGTLAELVRELRTGLDGG